jgi:hypothetical protein
MEVFYSLPLHFINVFSNEEANHRLTSALVSSAMTYFSQFDSLYFYLGFLLIDLLKPRSLGLSKEVLVHHGLAASLVLITLNRNILFDEEYHKSVDFITTQFLLFERTTPLLHLAWILRYCEFKTLASAVFLCLLLCWIPWRLQPSYAIFVELQGIVNSLVWGIVCGLCAMQWYWFYKLCTTFASALMPRDDQINLESEEIHGCPTETKVD